jgi:hypothetical protein
MVNQYPTLYFNTPLVSYNQNFRQNEKKVNTWFDKLQARELARVREQNSLPVNQGLQPDDLEPSTFLVRKNREESLVGYKDDIQNIAIIDESPVILEEIEKTIEEKGKEEHLRTQATRIEAERQSVDDLVKSSNRCIITISSGYAWSFFPDTINVEESRITFIFRQLFASQSHSVDIKDISNVFIESSLFSATLQIVSKTYVQNDIKIGNLDRKKAVKVRMIIEGLRTLSGHNLNTSSYTVPELISKIEEMHASQGGEIN